jgi:hypothetical protein
VTAAFGDSYAYDANGNQTARTISGVTSTLTYDYENRLTSVSGGSTATFLYDANGNRVKGTVDGVTTVYIAGLYEWQDGSKAPPASSPCTALGTAATHENSAELEKCCGVFKKIC